MVIFLEHVWVEASRSLSKYCVDSFTNSSVQTDFSLLSELSRNKRCGTIESFQEHLVQHLEVIISVDFTSMILRIIAGLFLLGNINGFLNSNKDFMIPIKPDLC